MTWTIEKHGDGFALYSGRTGMAHGLNLFNISDVDSNFTKVKAMIEAAPEMYELLERLVNPDNCKKDIIHIIGNAESLLAKARGEL